MVFSGHLTLFSGLLFQELISISTRNRGHLLLEVIKAYALALGVTSLLKLACLVPVQGDKFKRLVQCGTFAFLKD